jgi:hypothetical protein
VLIIRHNISLTSNYKDSSVVLPRKYISHDAMFIFFCVLEEINVKEFHILTIFISTQNFKNCLGLALFTPHNCERYINITHDKQS